MKRMLVIDDDQTAVDIIRDALADEPIAVEWAPNAREGIAQARSRRPDTILLDVILEDGDDGWDVLRALKADPTTKSIPVVIHSIIDNPERARQLGADDVLVKPAPPGAIKTLAQRLGRPAGTVSADAP